MKFMLSLTKNPCAIAHDANVLDKILTGASSRHDALILKELGDERMSNASEMACVIGGSQTLKSTESEDGRQKIRITTDSWSTVDVMPSEELCQVDTVPCTGARANRTMSGANGTRIESKGENKFQAITDDASNATAPSSPER